MAGILDSNRDLWQLIAGTSSIWPPELIGRQLERNEGKLKSGLSYYKKPSDSSADTLRKTKLSTNQLEFVLKLSAFLGVDQLQAHDIYCSFLLREYRGSKQNLKEALYVERYRQQLLFQVRDYYFTERLYLLRSLKHLIGCSTVDHAYSGPFREFVRPLYENDDFVHHIVDDIIKVSDLSEGHVTDTASTSIDRHTGAWLIAGLREQSELLELLLVYYSAADHKPDDLLQLIAHLKRRGFGRWQNDRHLLDEGSEHLLHNIGFLQTLLVIDALGLENLVTSATTDDATGNNAAQSANRTFLESEEFLNLGASFMDDVSEHGPLLLAWATVQQLCSGSPGGSAVVVGKRVGSVQRLGNRAMQLKVFDYLARRLSADPFCGNTIIASLCQSIVYGLVSATVEAFDINKFGIDLSSLYSLMAVLVRQEVIARHFWEVGVGNELGVILQSALGEFPLDFEPAMKIFISLALAHKDSARQVASSLKNIGVFAEFLDRTSVLQQTADPQTWRLANNRMPYHGGQLVIPAGTTCEICDLADKPSTTIVRWSHTYDAWDVFLSEINGLLAQISYGSSTVQTESIVKVTLIARLLAALLAADSNWCIVNLSQLDQLTTSIYSVVHRFCSIPAAPIDLLAACIDVCTQFISLQPLQVWHNVQQMGFLPSLRETQRPVSERFPSGSLMGGAGSLNAGAYGRILAGGECVSCRYPLTEAVLKFITAFIPRMKSLDRSSELGPLVLFVCREIFPVSAKWRYNEAHVRENICRSCLDIFIAILSDTTTTKDSGLTLLRLISTGVDIIEAGLASQSSAFEGAGIQLIGLVRAALIVLNRLLAAAPETAAVSPIVTALSARPASRTDRHLLATVAQYAYHRHDPRLPAQSTLLLKNIAALCPMSLLACLGDEAECIRDVYLARLSASSEDITFKVEMLGWLSACVQTQPGIIEIFLNILPVGSGSSSTGVGSGGGMGGGVTPGGRSGVAGSGSSSAEFCIGPVSCLRTIMDLIENDRQLTYRCPPELLCAVHDFIHALWLGGRNTAMTALRETDGFWLRLCLTAYDDLPEVTDEVEVEDRREAEVSGSVVTRTESCSHVLRILALELHDTVSWEEMGGKVDSALRDELRNLASKGRFLYWSTYIRDLLLQVARSSEDLDTDMTCSSPIGPDMTYFPAIGQCNYRHVLRLLLAWRDLLVVIASSNRIEALVRVDNSDKQQFLSHLLDGLLALYSSSSLTNQHHRLTSTAAATSLILVRHWSAYIISPFSIMDTLVKLAGILQKSSATLHSGSSLSVPTAVLATITILLQESLGQRQRTSVRSDKNNAGSDAVTPDTDGLQSVLTTICGCLQLTTQRVTSACAATGGKTTTHSLDHELRLQTVATCALSEILSTLGLNSPGLWLPTLGHYSIIRCLMTSMTALIEGRQDVEPIQAALRLFIILTSNQQGAEALYSAGITKELCLLVTQLYATDIATTKPPPDARHTPYLVNLCLPITTSNHIVPRTVESISSCSAAYRLYLILVTSMLRELGVTYVSDALDCVGVHEHRIRQSLEGAATVSSEDAVLEAEEMCWFLSALAVHQCDWRRELPASLSSLMTLVCSVMQRSIALLVRPRLLQHILDMREANVGGVRGKNRPPAPPPPSTPLATSHLLQPQFSVDDTEVCSTELLGIQHRLLSLVAQCLIALRQFTPDLSVALRDLTLDLSQYDPFVLIGFGAPPVDQGMVNVRPTFGTLLAVVNLAIKSLTKIESLKLSSPQKSSRSTCGSSIPCDTGYPIQRSLVMFIIENALYLAMSQAVRYLRDTELSQRDKQLLKRELGAELNSCLSVLQRHLRCLGTTGVSGAGPSVSPLQSGFRGAGSGGPGGATASFSGEHAYLRLVDAFVKTVLK